MRNVGCGTRNRGDQLRALNVPQLVEVELDLNGMPTMVVRNRGKATRVESVGETWRIDDEWWRQPIERRYMEVVFEGGKRAVLFEDIVTGIWWIQTP